MGRRKMMMQKRAKGYAVCPDCNNRVCITYTGKVYQHHSGFNGSFYTVCPGSGKVIPVTEERGVKWQDKYKRIPPITNRLKIDRLREVNRELVEALKNISVVGILSGQKDSPVSKLMRKIANAAIAKGGGEG
jgi:hypothetical protein